MVFDDCDVLMSQGQITLKKFNTSFTHILEIRTSAIKKAKNKNDIIVYSRKKVAKTVFSQVFKTSDSLVPLAKRTLKDFDPFIYHTLVKHM